MINEEDTFYINLLAIIHFKLTLKIINYQEKQLYSFKVRLFLTYINQFWKDRIYTSGWSLFFSEIVVSIQTAS